jgi:hypothetical protein
VANAGHSANAPLNYRRAPWQTALILVSAGWLSLPLMASTATETTARPAASWCAYLSGDWGIDCSYHTFEQCREFISGVGGYCSPNPYAVFVEERRGYGKRRAFKRYR